VDQWSIFHCGVMWVYHCCHYFVIWCVLLCITYPPIDSIRSIQGMQFFPNFYLHYSTFTSFLVPLDSPTRRWHLQLASCCTWWCSYGIDMNSQILHINSSQWRIQVTTLLSQGEGYV
jgi:hypothetical protein